MNIDIVCTHHKPNLAHRIALRWFIIEYLVHATDNANAVHFSRHCPRKQSDFFHQGPPQDIPCRAYIECSITIYILIPLVTLCPCYICLHALSRFPVLRKANTWIVHVPRTQHIMHISVGPNRRYYIYYILQKMYGQTEGMVNYPCVLVKRDFPTQHTDVLGRCLCMLA